jgi:serine/threonine protein kinase
VSALNHPNIVSIHDLATANGADFLVLEYVPGKALEDAIPKKGLRLNEALRYAIQIADALAAAHAADIVHRDLKPGNVMVTPNGTVKLLDFGLAKLMERDAWRSGDATGMVATVEGTIAGTVSYIARSKPRPSRWTRAPIFSASALCSTKCSPDSGPSKVSDGNVERGPHPTETRSCSSGTETVPTATSMSASSGPVSRCH